MEGASTPVSLPVMTSLAPPQDLPVSGESSEAVPFADLLASAVLTTDRAGVATVFTTVPVTAFTAASTLPDTPSPMLNSPIEEPSVSQEGQTGVSIFSGEALVGTGLEIGTPTLFVSGAVPETETGTPLLPTPTSAETRTPLLPTPTSTPDPAFFSPFVGAQTEGGQVTEMKVVTHQTSAQPELGLGGSGLSSALSREVVQQQLRPASESVAVAPETQLSPDNATTPVQLKPTSLLNVEAMPAEPLVESRLAANTQTVRVETPVSTPMTGLQTSAPATVESTGSAERGTLLSFHEQLSSQSLKGEQMGERLLVMLNKDQRQATLRMDPPELGALKISLRVDGDQVSVQFQAANGQLREMLHQQVDRLRQFFDQQQMNLVDVSVSHDRSQEQQMGQGAWSGEDQGEQLETASLPVSGEGGAYSFKPQDEGVGFLDIYA